MAEASGDVRLVPAGAACRINALPNHVLTRAISFLEARQLVQTCVLSRRWRDLWRSVSRINASRDEFVGKAGTWEWNRQNVLFKKFFSVFLMLRNPTPLDEFNLRYGVQDGEEIDYDAQAEDANLWVTHALQCNVRCVVIFASPAKLYLNPMVFASKCFLTSLELSGVVLFPGFFKSLQMGCALLKRLELCYCPIADAEISSQTLKLFTIDDGCFFTNAKKATISIPSLVDFGYFSDDTRPPLLTDLGSLETATVSIGTDTCDTELGDFSQFLRGLSDVEHLDLCYHGPKETENNFQWCPKFNNLTILTLGKWCLCADFYALTVFLQNSPNLMKLILEIRGSPDTHKTFFGELEERCFSCEHLEIVKIISPKNCEDDPVLNNLEKFLVGNGISPDQIEIKHWL